MDQNIATIHRFYEAFARLDYRTMNNQYSEDIVFFDPMFDILKGDQVRSMWKMLCTSAKEFSLKYDDVKDLGDQYYTCRWTATYKYGHKTVTNHVLANMKIENGVIIEHSDGFSLHKWSTQALGFSGYVLGWNSMFQRQIKNKARKRLLAFMQQDD